jgi:NADH-quinone oxidoreductase subunit J
MTGDLILFLVLAVVAVAAALAMLFTRNAVYSALFLILNFSVIAVFYLLLNAPFIAMAQITVYAGAIMVLFLFVIMLIGTSEERPKRVSLWQPALAVILGLVLLFEVAYVLVTRIGPVAAAAGINPDFGSPAAIGALLFNQYLLPFEITSVLLLVAMIGAIVITMRGKHLEI